jgi:hypothetical protein
MSDEARAVTYGRGVWIAPYKGRNGEMILVALDRKERRLEERLVAFGDDHMKAADDLWQVVDREDPMPTLRLISPRPGRALRPPEVSEDPSSLPHRRRRAEGAAGDPVAPRPR